jgi:cell division protein FtsQ
VRANSGSPQRPSTSPSPGAQRRQELRQQRRADRWRHGWRFLVYSALAAGVGYGLMRQGWMLRNATQVEVSGSALVSREQVIEAANIRFPQPLLGLQPSELSRNLSDSLPVELVSVSRLMMPPRLRIELKDRQVVARAERRQAGALAQGFVDQRGAWISERQTQGLASPGDSSLKVLGWSERHRATIARLLEVREDFQGGLREIRFDPEGNLWVTTGNLGAVRLGLEDGQLDRRLLALLHLNKNLPKKLGRQRPGSVDLTDPDQPELSVGSPPAPAIANPGSAPGNVAIPAVPPRGGQ